MEETHGIEYLYFLPVRKLVSEDIKTVENPRTRFLMPHADNCAVVNLPIGPIDILMVIGVKSTIEIINPAARITVTYPTGQGEFTYPDEEILPHHIKAKGQETEFEYPALKQGTRPIRCHLWLGEPRKTKYIYDFGKYKTFKDIPRFENHKLMHLTCRLSYYIISEYQRMWKGGVSYKKDYEELSEVMENFSGDSWLSLEDINQPKYNKRHNKHMKKQLNHIATRRAQTQKDVEEFITRMRRQNAPNYYTRKCCKTDKRNDVHEK